MTCSTCNTIRNKITLEFNEMLAKFTTDDVRKLFYIKNVEKTYEMFKSGQVPFEWAGFVYFKTREEFNFYFKDDLNFYLSDEIKENFNKYSFSPDHGNLWSLIIKKLTQQ